MRLDKMENVLQQVRFSVIDYIPLTHLAIRSYSQTRTLYPKSELKAHGYIESGPDPLHLQ